MTNPFFKLVIQEPDNHEQIFDEYVLVSQTFQPHTLLTFNNVHLLHSKTTVS